jgi:hypothetical protein
LCSKEFDVKLKDLTRQQLLALGKQKTDIDFRLLVTYNKEELAELLSTVPNVLTPEEK